MVDQKKKLDVILGQSVTTKYIFLKDGKLLISVNGLSTYIFKYYPSGVISDIED